MFLFIILVFVIPFIVGWYYSTPKDAKAPDMADLKPSTLDGQTMKCIKEAIVAIEDENGMMVTIEAEVGKSYKVAGMMANGDVALSIGEHYLLISLENLADHFVKLEEVE